MGAIRRTMANLIEYATVKDAGPEVRFPKEAMT